MSTILVGWGAERRWNFLEGICCEPLLVWRVGGIEGWSDGYSRALLAVRFRWCCDGPRNMWSCDWGCGADDVYLVSATKAVDSKTVREGNCQLNDPVSSLHTINVTHEIYDVEISSVITSRESFFKNTLL